MKNKLIIIALSIFIIGKTFGQLTMPSGANKKAIVAERIGITNVQINYNRPSVNGREGRIWGELVHYGFADLHYGTSKAAPWRAGANENTTIAFDTEVFIENKPLAAGKYGLFIAMASDSALLIFSKANNAWGSFFYEPKNDALRVKVPVQRKAESTERLTFEFNEPTNDAATVSLIWEKVRIPFMVSVDLKKLQIESFRKEINSGAVYQYWQNMQTAANYCLVNNINFEEALGWADRSINSFFGESNFKTLSTYAGLLVKLNRKKEADSVMVKAIPMGKIPELFQFAYELCQTGNEKAAFEIFQSNYIKDPTNDYSILGMSMGHYALNNKKEALELAKKGQTQTLDTGFTSFYSTLISKMEAGKDIFK